MDKGEPASPWAPRITPWAFAREIKAASDRNEGDVYIFFEKRTRHSPGDKNERKKTK